MEKIKVGILKETKNPPDRRVAIPPKQAVELLQKFPDIELFIQPSDIRAYTNQEYLDLGLNLCEDLSHCDILIGVKEVSIQTFIPGKTYLFFSHTGKKQPHNREMLKAIIKNNIKLIDYEYLTNKQGVRLVAFGRWAGIVGAYNGILGYGIKNGLYKFRRAHECHDMEEFFRELEMAVLPNIKILITGGGRVANGAMEVFNHLGIKKVSPQDFLKNNYDYPVYSQIDPWHYVKHKDNEAFDFDHFVRFPDEYVSIFKPYSKVTDMLVCCHYWDPESPVFMTPDDIKEPDFKIKLIADISCDVGGPIPTTIRASSIQSPFYGINPETCTEADPFKKNTITIMAVDNLPGEAPRNSSISFANDLIDKIFPYLFGNDDNKIIKRATITSLKGKLTKKFRYLQDYLEEDN
ncbi:MAG: NAD(P)-dependent oxidoreductase [Bacteroidales bacterium]